MNALDRLHARLVRSRSLQRFTAFTRVLLAVGFLPPGLKKLTGEPFTQLPTTHPVGYFFDAFFQAQGLYVFVGAVQVAAALLLLHPRTATLGAVLYAPVIATITAVTWSIGFEGTMWVTAAMSLACLWLLVWDYSRLKVILPTRTVPSTAFSTREYAGWAGLGTVGGVCAWALAATTRLASLSFADAAAGAALAAAGAAFGLVVASHLRHWPAATENRPVCRDTAIVP